MHRRPLGSPLFADGAHPSRAYPRPAAGRLVASAAMLRCARGGCADEVAAALGYDLRTQRAWVYDIDPADRAGGAVASDGAMALCRRHADRTKVPVGWQLDDRRERRAVPQPVVADTAPTSVASPASSGDTAPLPTIRPDAVPARRLAQQPIGE
ncbi:MAG TPA: hypothetical protein DEP69_04990, partial [Acidimicrobiaceae bacterium]|nr:hypothetical protein [Acidimicrobiaceae bacterium]